MLPPLLPNQSSAFATFPGENGIAFTSDRDGDREIYTMNADGSGQTNISNHRSDEFFPESRPNEVPLPPHPELHRPLITVPKDIVKEATGPNGTKVSFEVSAEDI